MYKFSLIIPSYNISNFAQRFFESMDCIEDDVFVIFIDDCSNDNTNELIKKFIINKKNMILIKHDSNKGVSAAMNTGLKNLSTKWYFRIDPDDVIMPDFYETISKKIDENPNAKIIRYKFLYRFEDDEKIIKPNIIERLYFKMSFGWSCGINVEKFGFPYFKVGMKMEDLEMFGRQYKKTIDEEIFINKYLVEYTKNRKDSTMNTISKEVIENWIEAYNIYNSNVDLRTWRNRMYKIILKRRISKYISRTKNKK